MVKIGVSTSYVATIYGYLYFCVANILMAALPHPAAIEFSTEIYSLDSKAPNAAFTTCANDGFTS